MVGFDVKIATKKKKSEFSSYSHRTAAVAVKALSRGNNDQNQLLQTSTYWGRDANLISEILEESRGIFLMYVQSIGNIPL